MSEVLARLAKVQQEETATKKTQRDELVQLVLAERIELFKSQDTEAFASFMSDSKVETYAIRTPPFRQRIGKLYFDRTGRTAGRQASGEAIDTLESLALYGGLVRHVAVRVVEVQDAIYIDLGDAGWTVVEVSAKGWQLRTNPFIRFRRPLKNMALPMPEQGGFLSELRDFVNCPDDPSFMLLLGWCLAAFRPTFPTPILVLHGEQGSAKSTTARIIQSLIDSGVPALRSAPKTEQDCIVGARNRRVLAFDNLSAIPDSLSDALCRLSTDGGYGARALFTDADEIVFEGTRALILTGIDDLLRRHDLSDRALLLTLPPISEEQRRGNELMKRFEAVKPRIFGALLDALSLGLRRIETVTLPRSPRMVEFVRWATACEPALGLPEGGFLVFYRRNLSEAAEQSLEGDAVAVAVRDLMANHETWEGKPTDLLSALSFLVPPEVRIGPAWPKAPNSLSTRLRRAAPVLRAAGIEYQLCKMGQGATRRRGVRITKRPAGIVPTVPRPGDDVSARNLVVVRDDADDPKIAPDDPVGSANRPKDAEKDDTDDRDDPRPAGGATTP